MDIRQTIDKILSYNCKTNVSTDKSYRDLAPYRSYLMMYLCREQIGGVITVNVIKKDGKYTSAVDYRYTYVEPIDESDKGRYFIKPVMLTKDVIHATSLFFDRERKTVEYYDPNGTPKWYFSVLDALLSYLNIFAKGYRYISPTCPIGIQRIERDEFCNDWNDLMMYLRCLSQEDITVNEITNTPGAGPLLHLQQNLFRIQFESVVQHHRGARQQMRVQQRNSKAIVERQHDHHAVGRRQSQVSDDVPGVALDIPMADHHPFGRAGRTGGKHQGRQLTAGIKLRHLNRRFARQPFQLPIPPAGLRRRFPPRAAGD